MPPSACGELVPETLIIPSIPADNNIIITNQIT